MKKFKELQKRDIIWSLKKGDLGIGKGPIKYIILGKWEWDNTTDCWKVEVRKETEKFGFCLFIPRYSFSRPNSSQLYEIFATTEDELFRISKRFIIKEAERLDKRILEIKENLAYHEGLREKIDKLLIQVDNE